VPELFVQLPGLFKKLKNERRQRENGNNGDGQSENQPGIESVPIAE
jgi:hypothetical protein